MLEKNRYMFMDLRSPWRRGIVIPIHNSEEILLTFFVGFRLQGVEPRAREILRRTNWPKSKYCTFIDEGWPVRDDLTDHVAHVYRLAMRLTGDTHRAEDLTQETFLRAWQRSQQLKDGRAARAWLFQIAVNLMNDDFRKRNPLALDVAQLPEDVPDSESSPDLTTEINEELEHALELLDGLPERQRMVLYLTAVEDFSLGEVCQILKINSSTAKANLSLARKRMREEMAKRNTSRK